jgi:UDP-N-acetylmuramoyl-tripeptide--D-alanyl-D-alanine ligase
MQNLYHLYLQSKGVSTDTRTLTSGQLYFALKGPSFNGNHFAHRALEKGALAVVVDEPFEGSDHRIVLVDNVLDSLQQLAKHHRQKLGTPIIALTGSNGKTTTKELIHAVLKCQYKAIATEGNLNNHIGVPLTLLRLQSDTEFAVVEMGANHPGEIAQLAAITEPDYGLITNFGKAHLEGFGSLEGVVKAKSELYEHLKKSQGVIFANGDDTKMINQLSSYAAFTYGTHDHLDCVFKINLQNDPISLVLHGSTIQTRLTGSYNAYNAAAAMAIGQYLKIPFSKCKEAIENFTPKNNRSQQIQKGDLHITLDAYNANPSSMLAALTAFCQKSGEKVAILGQMNELGAYEAEEHKRLVNWATINDLECYWIGRPFQPWADKAHYFETTQQAEDFFKANALDYKHVLIKASRSLALENLVDVLH